MSSYVDFKLCLIALAIGAGIEWMRRESLLPRVYLAAHFFTAGFALLAWGADGLRDSAIGLGLCALGAPFLMTVYRNRGKAHEQRMAKLEAELAAIEKELDEELKREEGGP